MRISDMITAYILSRMEQTEDGTAELQRNTLAEELGCVPSQISYVLASRFTPENGYVVESRRGGGGYIRIHRVRYQTGAAQLMHIVNAVGDTLVPGAAQAILENLVQAGSLPTQTARVMAAALSDQAFREVSPGQRDQLRASLMKQMLAAALIQ